MSLTLLFLRYFLVLFGWVHFRFFAFDHAGLVQVGFHKGLAADSTMLI